MPNGMVEVQDTATGERLWRWPVDARELVACGACTPLGAAAIAAAAGAIAFPFAGKARPTTLPLGPVGPSTVLADLVESPVAELKPKKVK